MKIKVLRVDLTEEKIDTEVLGDSLSRKYMGGSALASYLLLNELEPGVEPFSEENVLVFTCSVLSGSPMAGTTRYTVASKSPLTGGFGESEAGGWWAPEFKRAGFGAAVITGKAEFPLYLWVKDGKAELRDASHLKGKSTAEAERIIREELDDQRIRIAQTGPAGENLVRYACVLNNVKHANGRTGMGAVMGSKNFRGIAVRGTGSVPISDPDKVKEINRWFAENWKEKSIGMYEHGSAQGVVGLNEGGILPTHNFRDGEFEGAEKISGPAMTETILTEREGCFACPIRCKRVVETSGEYNVDPTYGGPEYETIAALGSLCGVDDLKAVAKANELCNKYALDTISTGAAVAFAMECREEGIIKEEELDGIDLRFGNASAMVEMVERIALRKGLGDVLAEGAARASKKLGPEAQRYALHVKGQELPMHEPRGKKGLALAYALSPTGADHVEAPHDPSFAEGGDGLEHAASLGILDPVDSEDLSSKKVRMFSYLQKVWSLYNTLGICNFAAWPISILPLDKIVELTNAVTGWNTSLWELIKIGDKTNILSRCFNIREGFTEEDDYLPERIFKPLRKGALSGKSVDRDKFKKAVKLYYSMEGWDEKGIPTPAKLSELDLEWIDLEEYL